MLPLFYLRVHVQTSIVLSVFKATTPHKAAQHRKILQLAEKFPSAQDTSAFPGSYKYVSLSKACHDASWGLSKSSFSVKRILLFCFCYRQSKFLYIVQMWYFVWTSDFAFWPTSEDFSDYMENP